MKRILIPAALAISLCGGFALAQQPQPTGQQAPAPIERYHRGDRHAPDPHRTAARISKELNLTPDQTARVEPIIADRVQKMMAVQANTELTPKDRMKQFHAIHRDSEKQLAAILTADQLQQLKTMHHEGRGRRGQNQPPPPPAA